MTFSSQISFKRSNWVQMTKLYLPLVLSLFFYFILRLRAFKDIQKVDDVWEWSDDILLWLNCLDCPSRKCRFFFQKISFMSIPNFINSKLIWYDSYHMSHMIWVKNLAIVEGQRKAEFGQFDFPKKPKYSNKILDFLWKKIGKIWFFFWITTVGYKL